MARRGRPPKSDSDGTVNDNLGATGNVGSNGDTGFDFDAIGSVNPASIGTTDNGSGGNGDGSSTGDGDGIRARRKYTRRKTASKASVPVDVLSAVLFSGHMMLAGITRVPELALAQPESDELAKALNTVSAFYNVEVAEKTLAWINLSMVAGTIYGTRLMAIRARRVEARQSRQKDAPTPQAEATVFDAAEPPADYFPGFGGPIN